MQLDTLFPYILPEVPGCPDPLLRMVINSVAAEFCRDTLSWSEVQSPTSLVDGVQDYVVTVPTDSYLVNIRDIWIGNRRLIPKSMQEIQMALPNWETMGSNEPIYYNQMVRGSIRLYPMPVLPNAVSIIIRAAYAPTNNAATLPDFIGQLFTDVIASGAKARLLAMPGAPWANANASAYYKTVFDDLVTKTRIAEMHDRVAGVMKVLPRSFGF